jgi:hypothetical protein
VAIDRVLHAVAHRCVVAHVDRDPCDLRCGARGALGVARRADHREAVLGEQGGGGRPDPEEAPVTSTTRRPASDIFARYSSRNGHFGPETLI